MSLQTGIIVALVWSGYLGRKGGNRSDVTPGDPRIIYCIQYILISMYWNYWNAWSVGDL